MNKPNEPYHPATFSQRWFIRGTLTTDGLFHLGDGTREKRRLNGDEIEVNAIFRDAHDRPCIPGSSLKGALRDRLATASGLPDGLVKRLFGPGADDPDQKEAPAGKVEFHDARVNPECSPPKVENVPFLGAQRQVDDTWGPDPWTGVTNLVAIERRTRAAREKKLAHRAVVPPQVTFQLLLTADNVTDEDMAWLLWALNQFNTNAGGSLRLGAETGNDWGKLRWKLDSVRLLDQTGAKDWIAKSLKSGESVADPENQAKDDTTRLNGLANKLTGGVAANTLTIKVALAFDGPFLVKDPAKGQKNDEPDAQPRLTTDGKLLLPARSFRGALRSQAERIVRTLDGADAAPDPTGDKPEILEWASGEPRWQDLSLPALLFGATGWGATLEISDFIGEPAGNGNLTTQEFVAIDRFTGGSAVDRQAGKKVQGKKFQAQFIWAPKLEGTIRFSLDRLATDKTKQIQGRGLLALLLRDLQEGDITFGLGASKGYGACRVEKFKTQDGKAWQPADWQMDATAFQNREPKSSAKPS
jgi:CRISPR/Cas system CSM-associated protein Csm3 (group 7 of RAMP superfamily)